MLKPADFSAVIFDMDGLVQDTEGTYRLAWQRAAFAMGHELPEPLFTALSGLPASEVEQKLMDYCGAGFNVNEFNRLSSEYWRSYVYVKGIEVKRGFNSLIDFLIEQNIPYCLATNSTAANAYECLALAGLKDIFSIVVTRERVEKGKPAPDIFLKAAKDLDVTISRCLVIEDSHAGIEAASRAGALSVFVPSVLPVDALTAGLCDFMVNDLMQLLTFLRQSEPANNR